MHVYILDVPDEDVEPITDSGGLDVANLDLLDDIGTAEPISSPADSINPNVTFTGKDASQRAIELHQLLNSPHHAPVPVTLCADGVDGYYAASSADRYIKPSGENHRREVVRTTLTRVGTQSKLVRTIEAGPSMADHEFGNDVSAMVALPASARKVRWLDRDSGERELAEPVETVATAYGDVDIYDLEDALDYEIDEDNLDDPPLLVYEIDKDTDADADVRLWDTRGHESLETDGRRQWQHVFSKDHEYDGALVLDNGLVRLWLDEADSTIAAERWDPDASRAVPVTGTYGSEIYGSGLYAGGRGGWPNVDLEQPEDVDLFDVDVKRIGMVRDRVQLTFVDDGSLEVVDAILVAGHDAILFDIPDGEGPLSTALEEWLEPIASETVVDPNVSKGLRSRNDV